MSAMSDYLENEILDHILRNEDYVNVATMYVALFDTSASLANLEAGTLTGEISGNAYARQSCAFDVAAAGATANTADCTFPTASGGNWGTVRFVAIMDADTLGNVLFFGQLTADKVVNDGDTFKFNAGDLDVTLD